MSDSALKIVAATGVFSVRVGRATLYLGDSADILPQIANVDSCVTDPPYGLSFMGKAWDYEVPHADMWELVLKSLKPGAHLLSFSGSRTYHRLVCQVEDGGFDIRDQIMWVFGSGFPKSHNIAKAIDKTLGGTREVVGKHARLGYTVLQEEHGVQSVITKDWVKTSDEPVTDEARQWRGWGTALKPAHEPIVMARKPLNQSIARNVLQFGTGAINIDACRIAAPDADKLAKHWARSTKNDMRGGKYGSGDAATMPNTYTAPSGGRFPANLIHDNSNEVVAHFPRVRTGSGTKHQQHPITIYGDRGANETGERSANGGDSGSAARFFYCPKASVKDRDEGLDNRPKEGGAFFQTANGTSGVSSMKGERKARANNHPTVKPSALMAYLCRLVTPAGGIVLDPFMGSGSTGKAALREGMRFIGIERDPAYFDIAVARLKAVQGL